MYKRKLCLFIHPCRFYQGFGSVKLNKNSCSVIQFLATCLIPDSYYQEHAIYFLDSVAGFYIRQIIKKLLFYYTAVAISLIPESYYHKRAINLLNQITNKNPWSFVQFLTILSLIPESYYQKHAIDIFRFCKITTKIFPCSIAQF